ncbi:hypothetical protein MLD38_022380 [Melastoma candidum]|uniref:Uncharacterized protein n=1 Tax=Melastoma candidum TaxID=119954 RepID=A0ACB9QIY1_9MYRT|nr:hypothetical protein MLD38_022380 [Melastoma candidum]
MILAEENGAVPLPLPLPSPLTYHQHHRNCGGNDFVVEEEEPGRGRGAEGMDGEGIGRGGREGERIDDEYGAMELGSPIRQPPLQSRFVVVGYALTTKKVESFLQPKLQSLARNKGIMFVPIDQDKPLSDQGPFDVVLHKLSGKEWRQILEDYRQAHPEVTVLDPPDAIQHLRDRQYMLQEVAEMNFSDPDGNVGVPKQLVIKKDASSIPDAVDRSGLRLPIVAKPLLADGSAKSHKLSLAYDEPALEKLEPPLVLQEFVNHGGVLFKVYVVGDTIKVVRRFSLPDVSKRELSKNAGVFHFPRVSCAAASADDADLDPSIAEHPPRTLLERFARELRQRLGLRLFNLDIIREHGTRDRFYVIDINYFPGYGKMPGYEHIFTDFILSLMGSKYRKRCSMGCSR